MRSKDRYSLKVSLHGMDERMQKMMKNYLKLTCRGVALVVEEEADAEVEIIDIDLSRSQSILEERLAQQPAKPIIVLSLQEIILDDVIFIQKPLEVSNVLDAVRIAKCILKKKKRVIQKQILYSKTSSPHATPLLKSDVEKQPKSEKKEVNNPVTLATETAKKTDIDIQFEAEQAEQVHQLFSISDLEAIESEAHVDTQGQIEKIEQLTEIPVISMPKSVVPPKVISIVPEPRSFTVKVQPESTKPLYPVYNPAPTKIPSPNKYGPNTIATNRRKSVRYTFEPISGHLEKNSLIGLSSNIPILLLDVSSKGALIQCDKSLKLRSKVTLNLRFNLLHIFKIPAQVIRDNGNNTYALIFSKSHHELTDYLVNSARPFNIN